MSPQWHTFESLVHQLPDLVKRVKPLPGVVYRQINRFWRLNFNKPYVNCRYNKLTENLPVGQIAPWGFYLTTHGLQKRPQLLLI